MRLLDRREFVSASSLALAAFPSGVWAARERPKYRACVIGHTGRGGYGHGLDTAFQKVPGVTVVGLADPDEKGRAAAARRAGAVRAYADYREMLARERPNLVAIGPYYV